MRCVMMPSPYTADISWVDARDMASRLGVRYDEISIVPQFGLRTFQEQSTYWMEVTRLMEEEPILFPHPGPLPPVDRVRVELIRTRSRELYAAPVLLPVATANAAPQKMTATGEVAPTTDHITTNTNEFGGIDVYEE